MNKTDELVDSLMEIFFESGEKFDDRDVHGSYLSLSDAERHVLPMIYFDSQVNNGGVHQFLKDGTGVLFPYVYEISKELNMVKLRSLCERLIATNPDFLKCHSVLSKSETESMLRPYWDYLDSFDKEYGREIRPEMFRILVDYVNGQGKLSKGDVLG